MYFFLRKICFCGLRYDNTCHKWFALIVINVYKLLPVFGIKGWPSNDFDL